MSHVSDSIEKSIEESLNLGLGLLMGGRAEQGSRPGRHGR